MIRSTKQFQGLGLSVCLGCLFVLAGYGAYTAEPARPGSSAAGKAIQIPRPIGGPVVQTGAETGKPAANTDPVHVPGPLLKGWAIPKVALVLSGEQAGYLEPCGCSAKQSGGFARRDDLFAQLNKKQWPVAALDLGGTLKRSRRHDQIKFEQILRGLNLMRYQALGMGPAELRLGAEKLLSLHEPEKGMAFVSSNVILFGDPELGTPLAYKIVEINGVKIGVTAVLGSYHRNQVVPPDAKSPNPPITVKDPIAVTVAALAKMKADLEKMKSGQPDLLVLLSYCLADETRALAKKIPEFDIILTTGPEEPPETSEQIGKTMLVQVGTKGKHVGIVGFYPDDPKKKLKYELVDLDKFRFKNQPRMEKLMAEFQERLTDEKLAETEKGITHESGAEFVGAAKCGVCHKKAYAKWATTDHAKAFDDLKTGPRHYKFDGKWVARQHDVECLACHVTGWDPREVVKFESGFTSFEKTPHLAGQQCENCHGPGSDHVKQEEIFKKSRKGNDPLLIKARQHIHLDEALAQKETGCYKCHDGDNSPKFKFAEFYKLISHKGLKD